MLAKNQLPRSINVALSLFLIALFYNLPGNAANKFPSQNSQEKAKQLSKEEYYIDHRGLQLTLSQFQGLSPLLQDRLIDDGYLDNTPKQRQKRSLHVNTPSAIVNYIEDSGAVAIISNPLEVTGTTRIDYVTVEILNVLDAGFEILDIPPLTMTHTADVGGRNVTFNYTISPNVSFSDGLLTITGLANNEEYELAVNSLTYENSDPEPTSTLRGIGIVINYGGTNRAYANVYFFVISANDSPRFASQPQRIVTSEDTPLTLPVTSYLIPRLFIEDSDHNSQVAIAVLGADNSNGEWRYQSSSNHLLLINDGIRDENGNVLRSTSLDRNCVVLTSQNILFLPHDNFYGETSITFVAWDKTGSTSTLSHGDFANVTWTKPGDPFSENMATFTVLFTPVNDAPSVVSSLSTIDLGTISEDSIGDEGVPLSRFLVACDDAELKQNASLQNLGVAITNAEANGSWQYSIDSAQTWKSITYLSFLLGENGMTSSYHIRFIPNSNFNGFANIAFKCWDFTFGQNEQASVDTSYAGSDGAFSFAEVIAKLEVLPTNDAPVFTATNATFPLYERAEQLNSNGIPIHDLINQIFRDVDENSNMGMAVTNLSVSSGGNFQYTCDEGAVSVSFKSFPVDISSQRALLLSASCRLRITTSANFVNNPASYFQSIPWDRTDNYVPGTTAVDTSRTSQTSSFGSTLTSFVVRETPITNRPIISGSSESRQYTEGDPPYPVFKDAILSSAFDVTFVSVKCSLNNVRDANEEVLVLGSTYGFTNEEALSESSHATVIWNSDNTEVTITGNFSTATCTTIIRSVSFLHKSSSPSPSPDDRPRSVEIMVTGATGIESNPFEIVVVVHPVNSRPHVSLTSKSTNNTIPAGFQEVSLFENLQANITDEDDSRPTYCQLVLEENVDGASEYLTIPTTAESTTFNSNSSIRLVKTFQVESDYNFSSRTLTFSLVGEDITSSDYQSALERVLYHNSASQPNAGSRNIYLSVSDGDLQSNVVNVEFQVQQSNESVHRAPTITRLIARPYTSITSGANLHTDSKISSGDEMEIIFDDETNMAPFGHYDVNDPIVSSGKFLNSTQLLELFEFSTGIATADGLFGNWKSSRVFRVVVLKEGYPQPVAKIGSMNVKPRQNQVCQNPPDALNLRQMFCIRDKTGTSPATTNNSPDLQGSWGLNVPRVTDVIAKGLEIFGEERFIGNMSSLVVVLQPALSKISLDNLCSMELTQIFGVDFLSSFAGVSGTLADCRNKYVAEWDISLDSEQMIPTVSQLYLGVKSLQPIHRASDVANAVTQHFNTSVVFQVISDETGVNEILLRNYVSEQHTVQQNPGYFVEHQLHLTPKVKSFSFQPTSNSQYNVSVPSGSKLTITFDKSTNIPPVHDKESLNKIFLFQPEIEGNYTGAWITNDTLIITLHDTIEYVSYLTLIFQNNTFADGKYLPDGFIEDSNCVGISVCKHDQVTAGICDLSGLSCRVQTQITFVINEPLGQTSDGEWWWFLFMGIILVGSIVANILLGRHNYRRRQNDIKPYQPTYDETKSDLFCQTPLHQINWCPCNRTEVSDDLFWSQTSKATMSSERDLVTSAQPINTPARSEVSSVYSNLDISQETCSFYASQPSLSAQSATYLDMPTDGNITTINTSGEQKNAHTEALARWHSAVAMICQQLGEGGSSEIGTTFSHLGQHETQSPRPQRLPLQKYLPSFVEKRTDDTT